jgi:Beta-galactosidase C-terminal domain
LDLSEEVEVTMREAVDGRFLFVLNTRDKSVEVANVPSGHNLLGKEGVSNGRLSLGPFGCAIIVLDTVMP